VGSITGSKWPVSKETKVYFKTHQFILVLRNEGYSKISYNDVYYFLHRTAQTGPNQNRKRRPRCTTEEEDKYMSV
jgi:hypothetical protein